MPPFPLPRCFPLAMLLVGVLALPGRGEHPQDGPHADIRIAVEDDVVRFSIGLNLAFLDHIVPPRRESLEAVAPVEIPPIRRGFEAFVRENNRVVINGEGVQPLFKSFHIRNDPDPAGLALFPKTGMRALIRGVSIVEYPAPSPPDVVEFTWGAYPADVLAADMEEGSEPSPMVLEALLQHKGVHRPIRFSEAEPTVMWRASEAGGADLFAEVPPPPERNPPRNVPALSLALGALAAAGALAGMVQIARGRKAWWIATSVLVTALIAASTQDVGRVALRSSAEDDVLLTKAEASDVFRALHGNLYRAFDYTDESEIYDALARSVAGPELEELYKQVYQSLVQAENDGMVGVVTGIEPLSLDILEMREGVGEAAGAFFTARHTWRVAGTVYHWGHSHTREHEYEGEYEIAAVPGEGWRIVDHRILRQTRLDPNGRPAGLPGEF